MKNRFILIVAAIVAALGLSACNDATTASNNLTKDAANFKIDRRIVFFNGMTDKDLLVIEGRCALGGSGSNVLTVTCKTGKDQFKKHSLGLSDNVSYFVEQTESAYSDAFHYKVMFRPQSITPDIDLRTQDEADDEWDESQSKNSGE